jgi:tetraacyldisaccharide 4'-kinase
VDFIVVNGEKSAEREFPMQIIGDTAINLLTGEQKPLHAFIGLDCHALAGIGNPARFFKLLESAGLSCETHSFPDHYKFQLNDIDFNDNKPVLMTEKDAVKCTDFSREQHWFVPVQADLEADFSKQLLMLLETKLKK